MNAVQEFTVGQRWLSNTEADLGLGVVMSANNRTVDLLFPAVQEDRTYAIAQAPITRLILSEGEKALHSDGWELKIDNVVLQDGLYIYSGVRTDTKEKASIIEVALDHNVRLNQPEKRLFSGQLDSPKWFDIRHECLQKQYDHATSGAVGLVGARVELIPHQLHIANEVGSRYAPRVLLADEVGLGKTIEAGLILHQQILTGKAKRALIVVPSSLVHQWLVEMLRRVNLSFSVFDDDRMEAMQESGDNPFEQEQFVLCSIDFIQQEKVLAQASAVDWDILVVDEAHHLQWSRESVSSEYAAVEALCGASKGVLLLTATPDQLGHESHFARLRLLDPARFHDYQSFLEEESHYGDLAQAVVPLIENTHMDQAQIDRLNAIVEHEEITDEVLASGEKRHELLRRLIDQHGTGRLLFRNSRASIKGFPQRIAIPAPLKLPKEYAVSISLEEDIELSLHPERAPLVNDNWTKYDPRVDWLVSLLEENNQEKVLVICAYASTALQMAEYLRQKTSIRHSVFHEGMSIVERDKAAHFFATDEQGAQVLLCSEIGSEGRNFQFSRHLVLFDLPMVPDLLEQRIGRLDRIGQKYDINIHVPFFENSAQHVLFDWYADGLSAFTSTCPVGSDVYKIVSTDLLAALKNPEDSELKEDIINQTASLTTELKQKIEQGRDKLLELNASGFGQIDDLLDNIVAAENPVGLFKFMTRLFDTLGVTQEEKDDYSFILRPTEQLVHQIPGLTEDGLEVTYQRNNATKFEQVQFLSWDSNIVMHCLDAVTTDVLGKSSIAFAKDPELPTGAFWIETTSVLSASAPANLQLYRFLPPTPVRTCVDAKNNTVDIEFEQLFKVKRKIALQLLQALADPITLGIEASLKLSQAALAERKDAAIKRMETELGSEIERLSTLQKTNPSIRNDEIEFIQTQKHKLKEIMDEAEPYLDSLRVVVNNP
ncbi:RNA polymerase-associated protein RapA [Glaciecola sp. MH2013]|uniref:RNA polymerase-associated protein RapA n=1 Tax=Glaciecola sp. MH2013 TaxID=2785524 RepID=UPI00189CCFCB|nr:RNA polymerase-associated protein RapA [Glaciecola sp. MH2013]MBF7073871.1 RNA polymerase-associated protein RapA [Glaciecola sp. MH2013]